MNPTVFAMRRPVTTLMLVVALISGGSLAFTRMRVDIFPSLNTPKIYVFLDYIGMSPDQVEGFIVSQLELYFQYVDGVSDINTRNIQQVALCELSFYPGTDMGQAMAQVVAMSDRAMSWMPKGTLPPMIMRMDAGSVPVGYLVLESEKTSLGMMGDLAQNVIRPLVQKNVPGTVAISPFGPNMRTIIVNVDPQKLLDYHLSPKQLSDALASGNRVIPAGNIYVKDSMPIVANNATVDDIQRLGDIPLILEKNVYFRDVATFSDDIDITYGYALVNGKKSVYLPIIKKDTGSTLTVVNDVNKSLQLFRDNVPKDVKVSFQFDESPTVLAAVESVATEGLIGAGLTGLMILLFLRDWRSAIVVVITIPLSLLGSMVGLWVTGNTINIMSLGGMALAIGILVDMGTVIIENVHVQMQRTENVATAVLHGSLITAVPILLALLCILSVFVPAFIMGDPLRSLFMPLTLAVGFAMISSYMLSSTFVPILAVALLKPMEHHDESKGLFGRALKVYARIVGWFVRLRWVVVPGYLGACVVILLVIGLQVGNELFPQIDSGQFVLRFRPPPGSNFELTREMGVKCLEEIEKEAGAENIEISMGYVGQVAPNFGINNMALFMRGTDDGQIRIALTEESGIKLAEFRERLRKVFPERIIPWMAERLEQGGLSREEALRQARLSSFGFQPGDMVTTVMSFGSLTPIAVRVVGTDLKMVRQHSEKIAAEMRKIPSLRDIQFEQTLDFPSVEVEIDREKAGLSGAKVDDVANALIMATASTRFSNLNYWIDVKTGFDYLVQLQIPPLRIDKPEDLETLPLESVNPLVSLMLRDVATVRRGVRPGELDRNMSQRYLTLTANVEGQDMGRASRSVARAIEAAGEPPRGVRVEPMGQLPPMEQMFKALGIGLVIAVFVILVLLTAYFQSLSMALISIGAVPGVLAGIATMLYFTDTTLNIESFMGSIMCIGVSVSNSVMLVTFMNDHWKGGYTSVESAIVGASDRLRPILMTACAMTVGMVPMALALERGSQMQAPLGRAVIGGLVMSTFATLLVLPSIFAMVIGRREAKSPSIYPDDPKSKYYDPRVFINEEHLAHHDGHAKDEEAAHEVEPLQELMVHSAQDEEVLIFLQRILDEAKSHRNDMTTHYTTDDLLVALGFAKPKSDGAKVPGAADLAATRAIAQGIGSVDERERAGLRSQNPQLARRSPMNPQRHSIRRSLMNHTRSSAGSNSRIGGRLSGVLALACLSATGCGHHEKEEHASVSKPPTVRIIHPEPRKIVRVVGQPSFIESYERTSIYPKVTGYIEKWVVDIGDKVKKGDLLAKLFVPELDEDFSTKQATVKLDEDRVDLALKMVEVADADVKAAEARVVEAKAILAKYDSEVDRWDTEVKRLTNEVNRGVVDPQILLESTNQWKSAAAARDSARATIMKAEAELLSKNATLDKTKVDVAVARSSLAVATSEAKRLEAWVGYLTLSAPYDGMIVARNANTFDFVQPTVGDPTANTRSPYLSPSGNSSPIYVVDRTDIVRIFIDIPEQDANDVHIGSKANVLVRAYRDEPIPGTVTRTSWALNITSRTLRAEIDLPNPGSKLLPGMYAYAKVIIERPGVQSLPTSALTQSGEKTFCWTYKGGHAQRTEVRTGISDGEWIEVTNLQVPKTSAVDDPWKPCNGSEQVILGDLSILADGCAVEVTKGVDEPKVASTAPAPHH